MSAAAAKAVQVHALSSGHTGRAEFGIPGPIDAAIAVNTELGWAADAADLLTRRGDIHFGDPEQDAEQGTSMHDLRPRF
ncbi:hypothetical protein [Nocardia niigatensis]|uniref:hypothetical protein n=1 Tax=Nocardia niigatensis TaxID=209249 RepID=UPI0002DFEF62|nr:hypothetical protein [Nocardia niigatensis]